MRAHPDDFGDVAESKARLADVLRQLDLWDHIRATIARTGSVELTTRLDDEQRQVVVSADRFKGGQFKTADDRPILVEDLRNGKLVHRFRAATVGVRRGVGSTRTQPTVDLVLEDLQVIGLGGEAIVNDRDELVVAELSVASLIGDDPALLPYEELIALAIERGHGEISEANWLRRVVQDLYNEIDSRLLKRYALSMTSLLLLLLGATLAMWLRNSVPLIIYVWAFLPSVLDIVLISSGEHMMRDGLLWSGAALMWSGNALMVAVLATVFWRLSRN
jgi:hypothetical protein